jgi:hypothetical protein
MRYSLHVNLKTNLKLTGVIHRLIDCQRENHRFREGPHRASNPNPVAAEVTRLTIKFHAHCLPPNTSFHPPLLGISRRQEALQPAKNLAKMPIFQVEPTGTGREFFARKNDASQETSHCYGSSAKPPIGLTFSRDLPRFSTRVIRYQSKALDPQQTSTKCKNLPQQRPDSPCRQPY